MKISEFLFDYPSELVAQEPLPERDASRMMLLDRKGQRVAHSFFRDLPSYFEEGDLILLNNTKVLPARLLGEKPTGGKVEVLLVGRELGVRSQKSEGGDIWECLVRSMKGIKEGMEIIFRTGNKKISAVFQSSGDGKKYLRFPPEVSVTELMRKIGAAPLPPYIKRKEARSEDLERYQTVFAEREGAIAAPTASLHFTPRVFEALREKGVEIQTLTLHVGLGTFQPIEAEEVKDHRMQTEFYEMPPSVTDAVISAKKEGRPVTAVGTTVVRAIESYFSNVVGAGSPSPGGETPPLQNTDLFITPGYKFKIVDRFLTNFHQPRSTPLLLTSAFAGREFLFEAYREAIEERYRLFSYGDCMLIL